MVPANSPESDLIERIKRREPEGLTAIYDRFAAAAYSVFLRITRDPTVAEDLLQELFFRIWNRSRHFDETKGALGVWILAIARNMAIDYVRSAQARFTTRLLPIDDINPLFLSSKSKEVEGAIDRGVVKAALAALNANEKRVLEMAYFDGLSQTEIAAKLEEPLGTVKSWMRSGLGRLRLAMKAGAAR